MNTQDLKTLIKQSIREVLQEDQLLLSQTLADFGSEVVTIPKAQWQAIQETLYLNSIPGMVESIHQAAEEAIEDCIKLEDLEW